MNTNLTEELINRYLNWGDAHSRQTEQIHASFLQLRRAGLRHLAETLKQQVDFDQLTTPLPSNPLLDLDDLNEFATGSVMKCLGPEYAVYMGRRSPRIPNGDLLLMSRILSIRGRKGEFTQPSTIVAEYDVPEDVWFFDGEQGGRLPYSICIEIALQPCGVLSAFLGTPLRFPKVDYYFRNLDGEAMFTRMVNSSGKTVRAWSELSKTIYYGSTIIQHFSFELECDGEVFFAGKSSFGYFSGEDLAAQAGLDGGKTVLPWLKKARKESTYAPMENNTLEKSLPKGKLRLLDDVVMIDCAGDYREGYVYAIRKNDPNDWFYDCHFLEDPVMPGSLGIEAIFQAMKVFTQHKTNSPIAADPVLGQKMNWSYRGQVLRNHRQMQVEVHFQKSVRVGNMRLFTGDASLWADNFRIYSVRNLAIAIDESLGKR
jgi:3-hydroxymyristoyl/3-hydroxydecanoyl-(acyl carrier protein) dehydratase